MSFIERAQEWLSSPKISPLVPKSVVCLMEGYTRKLFVSDLSAGITVGVISLPLAMAFSIGAGLDPDRVRGEGVVGDRHVLDGGRGASRRIERDGRDGREEQCDEHRCEPCQFGGSHAVPP